MHSYFQSYDDNYNKYGAFCNRVITTVQLLSICLIEVEMIMAFLLILYMKLVLHLLFHYLIEMQQLTEDFL